MKARKLELDRTNRPSRNPQFGPSRPCKPQTSMTTVVGYRGVLLCVDPMNRSWLPFTVPDEHMLFWDNHNMQIMFFDGSKWHSTSMTDIFGSGMVTALRLNGKRLTLFTRMLLTLSMYPDRVYTPQSSFYSTPIGTKLDGKSPEEIARILSTILWASRKILNSCHPGQQAVVSHRKSCTPIYGLSSAEAAGLPPVVFRSPVIWTGLLPLSVQHRLKEESA